MKFHDPQTENINLRLGHKYLRNIFKHLNITFIFNRLLLTLPQSLP